MFLGIDIGTSSVKAVLLDERDAPVAQASMPLALSRPQPLWVEQDPGDWWRATVAAIRALPPAARAQVRAIGLSGQMHGATLLDRSGHVLRPAMLWNDGRAALQCVELERREPRSRTITGNLMMPGFTAPKLLWVAQHEPQVFARIARVLLPKDYLRLQMTGEAVSDMSDASGTGWLDVGRRDWSDAMLAATGLDRSQMPRLVEGSAASGMLTPQAAAQLQLPPVVVAGGAGDNAATAAGMGVIAPGQALLSLGTSGVLFVVTGRLRPNPDKAAHAYCHCLPGLWHQMSVMLSAASVLDWVAQLTGETDLPRLVGAAQARGLTRSAPYLLPYLSGERTPHNDPHCRGVLFGVTAQTTGADLALAALEGVALAFADGMDVLLENGGMIGEISVSGGGARLPYWGTLLAAALNRPLTWRAGSDIGAAIGAARLGRLALSGESPQAVCVQPPVTGVILPDAALAALLAERRAIFVRLYRGVKDIFLESAT